MDCPLMPAKCPDRVNATGAPSTPDELATLKPFVADAAPTSAVSTLKLPVDVLNTKSDWVKSRCAVSLRPLVLPLSTDWPSSVNVEDPPLRFNVTVISPTAMLVKSC